MKLPNKESAYIPKGKLVNYLLSTQHPVGKSKAKFFNKIGFNNKNSTLLEQQLLNIAKNNEVNKILESSHGKNYQINGQITTPESKAVHLTTVWCIKVEDTKPSFVTAYPV